MSRSLFQLCGCKLNQVVESYSGHAWQSTIWLNDFRLLFCDYVRWACFGPLEMIALWAAKIVPQSLSVFERAGCLAFTM